MPFSLVSFSPMVPLLPLTLDAVLILRFVSTWALRLLAINLSSRVHGPSWATIIKPTQQCGIANLEQFTFHVGS